jgi:hypothetical protein
MLAPLSTRHVVAGIEHVLAADLAEPPGIILEEFDLGATVRAHHLIDVVQFPVAQILSRTMYFRHPASPYFVRSAIPGKEHMQEGRPPREANQIALPSAFSPAI